MQVTVGRIVLYTISEQDATEMNRRRTTGPEIAARIKKNTADASAWPIGAQAHIGRDASSGDVVPMIVVAVGHDGSVSGQAFMDGNDVLWVKIASEGTDEQPGTWHWPPRI